MEWADVLASELVSMALVSLDDQHVFYAERDPLPEDPTPWVKTVVYPLLERGKAAMTDAVMTHSLRGFLASMNQPVVIHYDSGHDRGLCQYVIDGFEVTEPEGPYPENLQWSLCANTAPGIEAWWTAHRDEQWRRHHALLDAQALKAACLNTASDYREKP